MFETKRFLKYFVSCAFSLLLSHAALRAQENEKKAPYQLHGYGELHFNHPKTGAMSQSAGDEIDIHRWVIGRPIEPSPVGTTERLARPYGTWTSAPPPVPSVETLGYDRASLRDAARTCG